MQTRLAAGVTADSFSAHTTYSFREGAMRSRGIVLLLPLLAGCYHAVVETGRQPSDVVIENKWASSFVHGLVPPDVVNVASQCPNGVARVETRLSFLNMLVTGLTFGIYSPMEITVTCAAGGAPAPEATARDDAAERLQAAIERAVETREPVLVRLAD